MKNIYIHPRKIMIPGEPQVARPDLLRGYYHALQSRRENCLPPVVVMSAGDLRYAIRNDSFFQREPDIREALNDLPEDHYCLFDGTHRSMATELLERKVKAYVISRYCDRRRYDDAMKTVQKTVQGSGVRLTGILRGAESIDDLAKKWFVGAGGNRCGKHGLEAWNVEQGVHNLIEAGEIPYDMVLNYPYKQQLLAERMRPKRIQMYCRQTDHAEDSLNGHYSAIVRTDTTLELLCKQLGLKVVRRRRDLRRGHKDERVSRGKICDDDIFLVDLSEARVSELMSPLLAEEE